MGFWLPAALMLLGVVGVIGFALFQRKETDTPIDELALARDFYQQQLNELDDSLAQGKIDEAGHAAAKLELDRELLRQSKEANAPRAATTSPLLLALPVLLVIAIAVPAYLFLGNPSYTDKPLSQRIAAGENINLDDALVRIEAHLAANPDDVQGWRVIAPVHMRMGAFDKAVAAFERIVELEGESPDNLTDLAEAQISANNGELNEQTRATLDRAGEIDPSHVRSRFYLAAEATRAGRNEEAAERWRALLALSQGDEAWVETARQGLAQATSNGDEAGGPSEDDIAAAAEMNADDRAEMISQMVAGLQERLYAEGGTPAEWAQLLRAQLVLKNIEGAKESLQKANAQFENDAEALATFKQLAASEIKELEGDK
jgi:cytochrome c-type biogenesis protein CcmH